MEFGELTTLSFCNCALGVHVGVDSIKSLRAPGNRSIRFDYLDPEPLGQFTYDQ